MGYIYFYFFYFTGHLFCCHALYIAMCQFGRETILFKEFVMSMIFTTTSTCLRFRAHPVYAFICFDALNVYFLMQISGNVDFACGESSTGRGAALYNLTKRRPDSTIAPLRTIRHREDVHTSACHHAPVERETHVGAHTDLHTFK